MGRFGSWGPGIGLVHRYSVRSTRYLLHSTLCTLHSSLPITPRSQNTASTAPHILAASCRGSWTGWRSGGTAAAWRTRVLFRTSERQRRRPDFPSLPCCLLARREYFATHPSLA